MLIVYCLKGVSLTSGSHGIPEAIAIGVTVALHNRDGSIRRWFPSPAARCAISLLVQMVFSAKASMWATFVYDFCGDDFSLLQTAEVCVHILKI